VLKLGKVPLSNRATSVIGLNMRVGLGGGEEGSGPMKDKRKNILLRSLNPNLD